MFRNNNDTTTTKFHQLLQAQIRNEFTSSQQYVALAVWFDAQDLPRLAKHFYAQSLEERNHAMMIVQYLLDNNLTAPIPSVPEVRTDFADTAEVIALALRQEQEVTEEIVTLAKAARDEGDYMGEQFMQWFLREQTEEVAQMSTLLNVVERAASGGTLFDVENYLDRETVGHSEDHLAPRAAGGAVSL